MPRDSPASSALKPISRSPSRDALQLVGQLGTDGIAELQADPNYLLPSRSHPPRSLKAALEATDSRRDSSGYTTSDSSEEDYDALKPEPSAVIVGSKGGGFEKEQGEQSRLGVNGNRTYEEIKVPIKARPSPTRLKSIPVTLNKLNEKGRYILTADDDALREILRVGIEREKYPDRKRRKKFSDLVFTRQFTAFDRQNSASADSPFHGFFTLFWLGTAIYCARLAAENWIKHGNFWGTNEIAGIMFHRDVMVLGLSDGAMCAATGFGLVLQKLVKAGVINWDREGWIIQSSWEVCFLILVLGWTLFREWPWTHTVFFVLHGLVMLMKQHSYAFYNGHLSEVYKSRQTLQCKLKQLDNTEPAQTPSETTPKVSSLSTSYLDHRPTASDLNQRRQYRRSSMDGDSKLREVAAAIESGEPLDVDQIQTFARIMKWEIDALSEDLKGKSTSIANSYPGNLTLANHYEYIVLPTLVYELEYPRSDSISWYYVAEKVVAVFGVLVIMNLVSQSYIYPVVVRALDMKEAGMTLSERLRVFPWILSDLMFPFMTEYMLSWYVIWELILNVLAEVTYFADRGFYADWWNSVSWDQFARDWNRPVHNFLLRHVYHSSISSMQVNKKTATLITFFLSACVHELVMWCLFKKLRGYLLFLQMMQLPLVSLSRTRWLKGRATLGNLIFWVGIFTGPSLLCSLYLII
ncbi:acyl-CoA/sterol acyltransferase [Cadophora gregata]|uniref:acyl-CoA/sterol acyltransferase n=1 Tax=Cadophora gregata TaxID=51156 RepID=UPI0026DBCE55|nr:acyl-CoA/sterol acyltransferase [Cadophora gregata]KAK0108382.1 acyl-CoA/sterol acyltransferase [Cadophora gregata]KAK0109025.1 acyl-CoA/sterol acyltransferase [Cadophora gregata f. sp. sojae]